MSDYHLLADATPLTQANKLELGFRQLRKTVERKLGKKEDPAIVKVQSKIFFNCINWKKFRVTQNLIQSYHLFIQSKILFTK